MPDRRRWAWILGTIIVVASVIEMVIIVGQAARGTHSHFNVSTALNSALWSTMGIAITVLWLATLVVAAFAARRQFGDRPFTLAIRFGLLLALIGMALGFLMTVPTADQLQTIESGATSLAGAHSVGVVDGGPGLPVTAWSTTGGDLRVPHFVGMHALQALPLLAWLLTVPRLGLDERTRSRLVATGAAGYLGLVGLLLWQGLRGQPLIARTGGPSARRPYCSSRWPLRWRRSCTGPDLLDRLGRRRGHDRYQGGPREQKRGVHFDEVQSSISGDGC